MHEAHKPLDDRLWTRAQRYLRDGQVTAARIALETFLQKNPDHVQAHLTLGGIAYKQDRLRAATSHALDAARRLPADPESICDVVAALLQVGEIVQARRCLDHPALAGAVPGPVLVRLAGQRQAVGEHGAALALLKRAREAGVGGPEFGFHLATQLGFNGNLQEAEAELDRCVGTGMAPGRAYLELARMRRQTPQRNHLSMLSRRIECVEKGGLDHVGLEFARYKELDDLGRCDEAWEALARGNAMMAARLPQDSAGERRILRDLVRVCGANFVKADGTVHDGPQPIFVIGMPRSGTTLLERMLSRHSRVSPAGELGDFARQLRWVADHGTRHQVDETLLERLPFLDYAELGQRYLAQTQWRAHGRPFFIDKLPPNWMLAGLIRRALPQARILHMVRAPMDVCYSNYRALFGDSYAYSYELGALARHYRGYRQVMEHWHEVMPGQVLDVAYGRLVNDPGATVHEVLAFCGLDWEPGCADPRSDSEAVATLSYAQVREAVHTRGEDAWRCYSAQLRGLSEALAAPGE